MAKEMLKKAGYSSGMYTGPQVTQVADNTSPGSNTALVVAADLAKIGFKVKTISVTHATMYTKFCNVPKQEPNICPNVGWLPDFHEPQTILDPTFNGKNIVPVNNSNWPQLNDPASTSRSRRRRRSSTQPSATPPGDASTTRSRRPQRRSRGSGRTSRRSTRRASRTRPRSGTAAARTSPSWRSSDADVAAPAYAESPSTSRRDAPGGTRRLLAATGGAISSSTVRYIFRRILWGAFLLLVVSALTFLIFDTFPSADPAALRAGRSATPELIAQIRHQLGLDRPLYDQYWIYLKGLVLHFDLGYSYQNDVSVRSQIFARLPATISLTAGALVVWLLVGIPVGVISAIRRRSPLDRVTMGGALIAISAPVYWLGLIALFLFASDIGRLHLFGGAGTYVPLTQDPRQWLDSLVMPWIVLAAAFAAFYARMVRGNLIEVMDQDYIRTARAKGLSERRVVYRHGLRAALTPVVTLIGLDVGLLLGGAVLTETVFNIPGVGRFAYDSIVNSDLPAIQGTVLFGAFFIIGANIIVDVLYAVIDPRVRY